VTGTMGRGVGRLCSGVLQHLPLQQGRQQPTGLYIRPSGALSQPGASGKRERWKQEIRKIKRMIHESKKEEWKNLVKNIKAF